jgi:predicted pyridoxine 5'-phosphate oxidase superfamily flavin-nucleotide-binding protein
MGRHQPAPPDSATALPGSIGEHELQRHAASQDRAHRFYRQQVLERLNERMIEFVGRQEMVWIATADGHGECNCSFRAGPPGFVRILDPWTMRYPEYRGNGVMASLGDLLENPHIGMVFLDFDRERIGLHVNGTARIVQAGEANGERAAGRAVGRGPRPGRPTSTATSTCPTWSRRPARRGPGAPTTPGPRAATTSGPAASRGPGSPSRPTRDGPGPPRWVSGGCGRRPARPRQGRRRRRRPGPPSGGGRGRPGPGGRPGRRRRRGRRPLGARSPRPGTGP